MDLPGFFDSAASVHLQTSHLGGEARAQCSALCYRGLSEARALRWAGHVARIDPKPLLRLPQRCWVAGVKQPTGRIKGLYDLGLVSCLRACADLRQPVVSDRCAWYDAILIFKLIFRAHS